MHTPLRLTPTQRRRLAFWALAGVALLISHDAIFLVQLGPGAELAQRLRSAGHEYWGAATALLLGVAVAVGAVHVARMRALRRRARALRAAPARPVGYARRAGRAWLALALLVAAGFVVQESIEHVIVHGHLLGLGALAGPEYPLAIPVIGLITGVAALLLALLADAEIALVAAIADALARAFGRPSAGARRPVSRPSHRPSSVRARPGAGRAPPEMLVTTT